MDFVILDLEWNGTYSRRTKGFMNEIIEFGAVKVDENLNIVDTFSHLVRPQVGKKISGKVQTLTHLTNEELAQGMQYLQVMSRFKKWMGSAVLMTWGTSDILALIENCRYFCGNERIPFLKGYIDLQRYCEVCLHADDGKRMGLSTAAQRLGVDEDGVEHHRALEDSLLSLECLRKVYDPAKLRGSIEMADHKAFYDKILFKTVIVCDLSNPLIKRTDMFFNCERCGRRAHRESDWVLKNKSYHASFLCRSCRSKFTGRVQFKLKYDGLVVKKSVLPIKEVEVEIKEKPAAEGAPPSRTPKEVKVKPVCRQKRKPKKPSFHKTGGEGKKEGKGWNASAQNGKTSPS